LKKIVIIAKGEPPTPDQLKTIKTQYDYIIAADGGICWCLDNDVTPDCLIGDMDSFDSLPVGISQSTKLLRIPDQNTTDMQKALAYAASLNPEVIEVFASFGKRTDHSLGNVFILNNYSARPKLIMHDHFGTFSILMPGIEKFSNKKGQTISLFALSELLDIQLDGFEFPVNREKLATPFLGVSNMIAKDSASISFEKGKLLVYQLDQ
jgi:thiamine pyrophosphokinase